MTLERKLVAVQAAAEGEVLQGIGEAVFHGVHLLLADGNVEDGDVAVMVEEGDAVLLGNDAVAERLESLGGRELVAALETLTIGQFMVAGAPRLVGHLHVGILLLLGHLDMHDGLFDIGPDEHPLLAVRHLAVAVVEHKLLPERLHVERLRQVDAETSQLQQRVVLVETATA